MGSVKMNKNFDVQIRLDSTFWVLVIALIAIILGFKYRKQLEAIFSGISDMTGMNK